MRATTKTGPNSTVTLGPIGMIFAAIGYAVIVLPVIVLCAALIVIIATVYGAALIVTLPLLIADALRGKNSKIKKACEEVRPRPRLVLNAEEQERADYERRIFLGE